MTELQKQSGEQAATSLQQAISSLLAQASLPGCEYLVGAARELGIDPYTTDLRKIEPVFAAAAERIKDVLRRGGDSKEHRQALEILDRLSSLNEQQRREIEEQEPATKILQGFKRLSDGSVELTLPSEVNFPEAAGRLNLEAKRKGMKPVFPELQLRTNLWCTDDWGKTLPSIAGRTHRFRIERESVNKSWQTQIDEYGSGQSLRVVALAAACEIIRGEVVGSFLNDRNGEKLWVRGERAGEVMLLDGSGYITCYHNHRDCPLPFVAYASSLPETKQGASV
ncbi:MAG: hypothetical protein KDD55_05270 [Bdellovibrionales bacterium]|nr:hypothetical protein [Bdellovibrionales bacterium]